MRGVVARWINLPRYIKWPTSSASTPGKITNNTTAMNTQPTDPVVGRCRAYIGRACDIIASASLKRLRARPAVARMPPRSPVFERGPEGEEKCGPAPKRGATNETPRSKRLRASASASLRWIKVETSLASQARQILASRLCQASFQGGFGENARLKRNFTHTPHAWQSPAL
jgi:hypothetical protein